MFIFYFRPPHWIGSYGSWKIRVCRGLKYSLASCSFTPVPLLCLPWVPSIAATTRVLSCIIAAFYIPFERLINSNSCITEEGYLVAFLMYFHEVNKDAGLKCHHAFLNLSLTHFYKRRLS